MTASALTVELGGVLEVLPVVFDCVPAHESEVAHHLGNNTSLPSIALRVWFENCIQQSIFDRKHSQTSYWELIMTLQGTREQQSKS